MKKILQLTTYPMAKPNHGGQMRVDAIRTQLRSLGYDVHNCSLSEMGHGDHSETDMIVSKNEIDSVVDVPFCGDLATAILCTSGSYYEFLSRIVNDLNPDIIFLEQPWLWPAVKKFISSIQIANRPYIVYSSQNIEYVTKKNILGDHGISRTDIISKIMKIESDLSVCADLVIAVSSDDMNELKRLGASIVIIAPNGTNRKLISNSSQSINFLLEKALLGRKFALFIGSAYPPNAQGFWRMMNYSLAYLRHDEFIVVAGGVSDILFAYGEIDSGLRFQLNKSKVILLGKVSDEILASLLDAASVVILPITSGGGSNLKTAEAIASFKPTVATRTSCRGYDTNLLNKLSDFSICEDADSNSFVATISEKLLGCATKTAPKDNEIKLRESIYWDFTLRGISTALKYI